MFHQHISLLWRDPDFKYEETSQQDDVLMELAQVHSHWWRFQETQDLMLVYTEAWGTMENGQEVGKPLPGGQGEIRDK